MRVSELINVPVTSARLPNLVLAVTVDLSRVSSVQFVMNPVRFYSLFQQPGDVLPSLLRWLSLLRARVSEGMSELRSNKPLMAQAMLARTAARFPDGHPDLYV